MKKREIVHVKYSQNYLAVMKGVFFFFLFPLVEYRGS
jgi:hypothetical protein